MRYPDTVSIYVDALDSRGTRPDDYAFVLVVARIPAQIIGISVTREVIQNPQALQTVEVYIPIRNDLGLAQGYVSQLGRFMITNLRVPTQKFLCQVTNSTLMYTTLKGSRWLGA